MRLIKAMALILGLGLVVTPAASAQDIPPPDQQEKVELSEKELETFAEAYLALAEIREEMTERLDNVQSPEEAQEIQQEANTKMVAELEEHEYTAEEYTVVVTALNQDAELRARFEDILEKLMEEEEEGDGTR